MAWAQIHGSVHVVRDGADEVVPYWTTAVFGLEDGRWRWLYWGGSEPQASPGSTQEGLVTPRNILQLPAAPQRKTEVAVDRDAVRVDARAMALLLAASMVVVVTYCLARMVRPSLRDPAHRRDLDAWHALMGVAMAAMLVVTYTRVAALLALTLFVVGIGWSVSRLTAPGARAAYLRLGLGCAAMAAMLLPTATASATTPLAAPAMAHAMPMGHAAHPIQPTFVTTGPVVPPAVLVMAMLAAVAVIFVIRLAGTFREGETAAARIAACCDVAMAAAMGFMLVAFL